MCSSILTCNKVYRLSINGRLSSLKKWKLKLFTSVLICTIIVIYLHICNRTEASEKSEFKTTPPPKANSENKSMIIRMKTKSDKFKTRAPPTASPIPPGRDPDFENVTRKLRGGLEEIAQQEMIILKATSIWANHHPPTIVLDSDKCSILKTGTTQQPPVSLVFDKPCRITHDHRYLSRSHAVVFHSPDIHHWYSKLPKTLRRAQDQIWVWYQTESPLRTELNLTAYRNIFNWTMSYRRDSDVCYPYGYIYPRNISSSLTARPPLDHHHRKSLKMKSGLAAWIVSTCVTPSKREYFVDELQKYVRVDIFGTCGNKSCPQNQFEGYFNCYNHIQSNYKFYLAFENSLCVDYITEKFYLALQTNMVPVVYGGGIDDQMDYLKVAPQNSFIDARKFKSPIWSGMVQLVSTTL